MRRRLILAIAGVATGAVALFAFPLAVVLQRNYRAEELLKLQRDAVAATRSIDVGGKAGDPIELPSGTDRLLVYDANGRLLAGRGPSDPSPLLASALGDGSLVSESSGGTLAVAVPLLDEERISGALLAERDDAVVDRRERSALIALIGLALGIVALAAGAASLMARRLARPLERLAAAAGDVEHPELVDRVEPAGIAEFDAIAAALSESARRLDETLARERAFTSDASHQLRTPLAALRIELESIELEGDPPEQVSAALGQVDRLQATIDTLLTVARDLPRGDLRAELVALVKRAERDWQPTFAGRGRRLVVSTTDSRFDAAATPEVIVQILNVLLENADQHGSGTVTIRLRRAHGWPAVDVSDEGPGLGDDPEGAFVRRRDASAGHGIGLSLARSLAEAEGGSLRAPEPDGSSVFTLLLPPAQGREH